MKLLFYIAVLPALFLLVDVYQKDRLDAEPTKLLWKLVGFGALSAIPAVVLEIAGELVLAFAGLTNGILYKLLECFLVVGLAEEGSKYLMLKKLTWKNDAFNCSYDGLLYAVYVSMGFALIENILYVIFNGGALTGIVRAVTAIPGHCFFGVFMGVFYARAKNEAYHGNAASSLKFRLAGLGLAVLTHGAYDFFAMLGNIPGILLFLALLVFLYIFGIKAIRYASANDTYFDTNEMERVQLDERWTCPACQTSNVGLFCTYCDWHIPESGSTEVPVMPQKPMPAGLLPAPRRSTKITALQKLLVFFSGVGSFVLSMVFVFVSFDIRNDLLLALVAICGMVAFFGCMFLPFFLYARFRKQADKNEPEYLEALELYRENRRRLESEQDAYEKKEKECQAYHTAVAKAQKKRAAENR